MNSGSACARDRDRPILEKTEGLLMPVLTQKLETWSALALLRAVRTPLKIPAWSVVAIVAFAGLYGFLSGREMPRHHYVPYVGYPLVLDTTTGKEIGRASCRERG